MKTDAEQSTSSNAERPLLFSEVVKGNCKENEQIGLLEEYADRERRGKNLIIHNIPENKSEDPKVRQQEDNNLIQSIIKEERLIKDVKVTKTVRLGGRNQNQAVRPRLLLVQVDGHLESVLSKARNLRNSVKWRKAYIDPHRTPQQRQHHKELRSELKRRREAGERNIVIKLDKIIQSRRKPTKNTKPSKVQDETGVNTQYDRV